MPELLFDESHYIDGGEVFPLANDVAPVVCVNSSVAADYKLTLHEIVGNPFAKNDGEVIAIDCPGGICSVI